MREPRIKAGALLASGHAKVQKRCRPCPARRMGWVWRTACLALNQVSGIGQAECK
jgi:hypothetical protein